jgi:hypothetical protein
VTSTPNSLNSNHQRRVSATCRHIDQLLAEMESALDVSNSNLAFPQYISDLTLMQRRVIEDYIGRVRAQLILMLDSQRIEQPAADIPVSRSLLSHLTFMDVAAEELKPEHLRGYGEVPPSAAMELNRIVVELQQLVRQFHRYVDQCTKENERNNAAC